VKFKSTTNDIFPLPVSNLLKALSSVGFFEESLLIGSWVMPLYREFYGISYTLRTMDIDFAVELVKRKNAGGTDLQALFSSFGFTPFFTQSGIQKFSREGFTIEFIAHRRTTRGEDAILIKDWNITAVPLPFINILTSFSFVAEFLEYRVKAPIPEAFFLHKLIIASRRKEEYKSVKDLDQCAVIAAKLDKERLYHICRSAKFSSKTWSAIRASCEKISFPPYLLGLKA
jgi:hypothetical protein